MCSSSGRRWCVVVVVVVVVVVLVRSFAIRGVLLAATTHLILSFIEVLFIHL